MAGANFLSLPIEVRQEIFEKLFSEGETLHLPEPERATISAALLTNKTVRADLAEYETLRPETLKSTREQYNTCAFTASPGFSSAAAVPVSPQEWPRVKHIEIIVDDLALQQTYQDSWNADRGVVVKQVAEMQAAVDKFVAWVCSRPTAIESIKVRFTHDEDEAPVLSESVTIDDLQMCTIMWHLLSPLLKLPVCSKATVEQTQEARMRLWGIDGGVERVEDLQCEYEMEFKFALQGWLKCAEAREWAYEEVASDLAEDEWVEMMEEEWRYH